jgi:O-antigen/teichoic acid export membrane protein
MFEVLLLAGVGAGLIMSAGSGFIVSVIGGSTYAGSGSVLAIQSFALIGSFLAAGWSFALLSLRLHRELLLANAAALLVSIVLTAVLAHADGARGAAIATICGETTLAVGAGLGLFWGRSQYRPQLGIVNKVLVAGALAGVVALLPSMPSLVRALVAAAVYGAVVLATKATPDELVELLPRGLQRILTGQNPRRNRGGEA